MKTGQHKDDLEELADRGYSITGVKPSSSKRLLRSGKGRYTALWTGLGMLALAVLVLVWPERRSMITNHEVKPQPVEPSLKITTLDTIDVVAEKFVKPAVARKPMRPDTVHTRIEEPVRLQPVTPTQQTVDREPVATSNGVVHYIHDLKVTDYMLLYFSGKREVPLRGTSVLQEEPASGAPQQFLYQRLAEGLLFFKQGRYPEAQAVFLDVASYHKDDINCDFYLGMCAYHRKTFENATRYFDLCLSNPNNTFAEEAEFYKALCLMQSGDPTSGRQLLKSISSRKGFYSKRAAALLD